MARLSRAVGGSARPQTLSAILTAAALAAGAGAASAPPPGFAGQPFASSRSFWRAGGHVRAVWFICPVLDGTDMMVVTLPDSRGRVRVAQPFGEGASESYRLGPPDPGAGQVYWPLTRSGREVGAVHGFNPGALGDPRAATTPTMVSIRISGAQWNCRWLEGTRLIGFGARRTVAVTQTADGKLEYRTFDFKDAKLKRVEAGPEQTTTASLDIIGGRRTAGGFEFDNGGFRYEVSADARKAAISVSKAGRPIQREPLIAWTIAPAP